MATTKARSKKNNRAKRQGLRSLVLVRVTTLADRRRLAALLAR